MVLYIFRCLLLCVHKGGTCYASPLRGRQLPRAQGCDDVWNRQVAAFFLNYFLKKANMLVNNNNKLKYSLRNSTPGDAGVHVTADDLSHSKVKISIFLASSLISGCFCVCTRNHLLIKDKVISKSHAIFR